MQVRLPAGPSEWIGQYRQDQIFPIKAPTIQNSLNHLVTVPPNSLSLFTKTLVKMDIQAEKLELIEWLAKLNNTRLLKQFISLKKEQEKDWWDQISKEEKAEIEEGLAQANKGSLIPHSEVMARYKK
jgi:hypothetical protein